MKTGKSQWVKEIHTTNDCMEKENSPLPRMSFLNGYFIQVVKPEAIYKQQKQTQLVVFTYLLVCLSLCMCVYMVCI